MAPLRSSGKQRHRRNGCLALGSSREPGNAFRERLHATPSVALRAVRRSSGHAREVHSALRIDHRPVMVRGVTVIQGIRSIPGLLRAPAVARWLRVVGPAWVVMLRAPRRRIRHPRGGRWRRGPRAPQTPLGRADPARQHDAAIVPAWQCPRREPAFGGRFARLAGFRRASRPGGRGSSWRWMRRIPHGS